VSALGNITSHRGRPAILAILALFDDKDRQVGVVHVPGRLAQHQGHLPVRNALLQFVTGAIALASGQSGVQVLYVNRISAPMLDSPVSIVTRQDLENFYKA